MADDGNNAKRLKTSEDDRLIADLRRTITELESEIGRRRGRRDWRDDLESEIEQRCVRRVEGNHEVLPVVLEVVVAPSVDLSRIDTSIVAQITSFLGTSRELVNLALTCKSFGWRQPTSGLNWSLVEEVARQEVYSRATGTEMKSLPRYVSGTTTWLSILHRFEHLLLFDVLAGGGGIEHRNGDESRVYGTTNDYCTAVSNSNIMTTGSHFAEFEITGTPFIGVARPMPKEIFSRESFNFFNSDHFDALLAARTDRWGDGKVHACQYFCRDGGAIWTSFRGYPGYHWDRYWEGYRYEGCRTGDTIGMLLNLDEGTLTVYRNNRRLGVMKRGLSGSYCWYVRVGTDHAVAIKRGALPNAEN
ncbi:hypothetical protein THAOC_21480 [Thalassiosira oceanica]|uniref:B30.2/SPRY domain-containing protein n=1 Tax=Thalassiosira oceanica TaxID=159749 RepID=K0SBT3_THAOC|nr:hypothetical protein THAOC_21480 [Thalassiosira oceanica]|eukprot:EJK58396.1 hypothetical protein THAOC_21480 [Thalassiosira oceanica]